LFQSHTRILLNLDKNVLFSAIMDAQSPISALTQAVGGETMIERGIRP
jgi:hypothetical protein